MNFSTSSKGTVAMKMTFIVCNSYEMDQVMTILKENGIDYFTSWEKTPD